MTQISKLIQLLEQAQEQYGDIEMEVLDSSGETIEPKSIITGIRMRGNKTTEYGIFSDIE